MRINFKLLGNFSTEPCACRKATISCGYVWVIRWLL